MGQSIFFRTDIFILYNFLYFQKISSTYWTTYRYSCDKCGSSWFATELTYMQWAENKYLRFLNASHTFEPQKKNIYFLAGLCKN